ncbi:endocuticle structural glycoprotein SgAbd-4 [Aethina tumida]|uniref:endocuticle structural glycoprotein SgAbd-4 n=1 Tax=Aethina tumida TaxID=116153 RepID=UPI00096B1C65|nr:endocuticle structural glycoprotein SgAbd-4 [Aethina tumida]
MMKLIVCLALFATVYGDVSHLLRRPSNQILTPLQPVRAPVYHPVQTAPGQVIAILRQESDISPDGSYRWALETENGIAAQEQGVGAQSAQGNFAWTSPEGVPVAIQYVADENGYQPSGDAIPQPPPIPAAIQRSLEWIAAHPPPPENKRF